jgi:hypothetical protein
MKSENLIHVKFEYGSALEAKRDILASEIDLLKISQRLKKYLEYRDQELTIKEDMERKLRALKLDFGRLQNLLPPVQIPEILKHSQHKAKKVLEEKEEMPQRMVKEIPSGHDDLEMQLQEIQNRLSSLQK